MGYSFEVGPFGITIEGDLCLEQVYPVKGAGGIPIRVCVKREGWPSPDPNSTCSRTSRGEIFVGRERLFWRHFDEFCAEIFREQGEVVLYLREDKGCRHFERFIFPYLLNIVLPRFGYLVIHCAVVRRDDRMIVFVGPTGSGKSTLSEVISRIGWVPLVDDKLIWSPALGYRFFDPGDPRILKFEGIDTHIIFPGPGQEHSIVSIPAGEAMYRLSLASLFPNFSDVIGGAFEKLAGWMEGCRTWQLGFVKKEIFPEDLLIEFIERDVLKNVCRG